MEAYGTVDELSSWLGKARQDCRLEEVRSLLETVQRDLVRLAGELASRGKPFDRPLRAADEKRLAAQVEALEARIPLRGFVIPGRTPGSAGLDIARTVARRAERRVVALARDAEVAPPLLQYLNRLSDLLFMLARAEEDAEGKIEFA